MVFPKAVLFDLDETLAESFRPPHPSMLERFEQLLDRCPVAIITGGSFSRIERDFLAAMHAKRGLSKLFLFTNSSAECYLFRDGSWEIEYSLSALAPDEKDRIVRAIEETVAEVSEFGEVPYEGERITDRGVQIAYTVVGLDAPQEVKMMWDSDRSKRLRLCAILAERLPGFEVLVGGASTIDVTRTGVDKSYGVRWLSKHLDVPTSEMLYIGDALFPGGNDYVVIPTGIRTRLIAGPEETMRIIDELLTGDVERAKCKT